MLKERGILVVEILLLLLSAGKTAKLCGHISIESDTVQLGSPLSASCIVNKEFCPNIHEDLQILWKLDRDFIPNEHYNMVNQSTSSLFISSFNKTSASLFCYIRLVNDQQLVDGVDLNAGYPPSKPSNLTCLMNLTDANLSCSWQLGKDPLIKTNVTLSISRINEQCQITSGKKIVCNASEDQTSCIIPRNQFHLYKKLAVWITAQNALGSVTSTLCFIPIKHVKLDPPHIKELAPVHSRPDCVVVRWKKLEKGSFMKQWYQLRYRKEEETQWMGPIHVTNDSEELVQCNLSPATRYHFQIRCIRSYLEGYWSEWGSDKSFLTSESAPIGKLNTWWRKLEGTDEHPRRIQLMWKAPKKEEANSDNPWYIVKVNSSVVCNTTAINCSFPMPLGRMNASVWIYNSAGQSPGTEFIFSSKKGAPAPWIRVTPKDDYSLSVEWKLQIFAKSYVLEWCHCTPHCENYFHWKIEPEGINRSILKDIEPFKRYTVWVHPVYEKEVGYAAQSDAYSSQGAPEFAPKLLLSRFTKSEVHLSWEPIPLERRHGFITNYTIFWTDPYGKSLSKTLNGSVTNYAIKNLQPFKTYHVFISCSTSGGSVNGSVLMVHTAYWVWPIVPDPANSSMAKWTPLSQESLKMACNIRDTNQIISSDLIILEEWAEKKLIATNTTKYSTILNKDYIGENSHKQEYNIINKSTAKPYINVIDAVQYAKVLTGAYLEQSPTSSGHIRSNSTQPLLSDISPSPKTYENIWFHGINQGDSIPLVELENTNNFPLLQALKIHEDEEVFSFYN
ncbi:hypothetical protein GDO86_003601 [Hymenochirus boettgeri]|uniref:Fibronectin type-III domain-containing protein n=1 Tax=Hymenochirus boettgeri TaxID=247094 RepID=A0A8T2K7W4_9PIPI|nr:hypothetical protein GDO86_003601 [Hymenochirus boettgeri]